VVVKYVTFVCIRVSTYKKTVQSEVLLAIEEDFLDFTSQLCVTYTMVGIVNVFVVTIMSSNFHLPHK
jgi:hypothetical protein